MAHHLRRLAPLTLAALALVATPASAAPDRAAESPLNVDNLTYNWDGRADLGANISFFHSAIPDTCAKADATSMCDETLIRIGEDVKPKSNSTIKFMISDYTVPASDYDIRVYESNEAGEAKTKVGEPESETYGPMGLGDAATAPGDEESTTLRGLNALKAGKYYLVQVVVFAAGGGFKGSVEVKNIERLEPELPAGE